MYGVYIIEYMEYMEYTIYNKLLRWALVLRRIEEYTLEEELYLPREMRHHLLEEPHEGAPGYGPRWRRIHGLENRPCNLLLLLGTPGERETGLHADVLHLLQEYEGFEVADTAVTVVLVRYFQSLNGDEAQYLHSIECTVLS